MRKKVLILVVAYNAEKTVYPLFNRFPKDVWERADEILVADDASKDRTYEVVLNYKKDKSDHSVKMVAVRHEKNKGYGGALRSGFNCFEKFGFAGVRSRIFS